MSQRVGLSRKSQGPISPFLIPALALHCDLLTATLPGDYRTCDGQTLTASYNSTPMPTVDA